MPKPTTPATPALSLQFDTDFQYTPLSKNFIEDGLRREETPLQPVQRRESVNDESAPLKNGSHGVQRGKNWNEEDSIHLIQAYAWMESIKKRTHSNNVLTDS